MPRDAVTPTVVPLAGGVVEPAGVTIVPGNGCVVQGAKCARLLLRITNTEASPYDVTIKAGANPPAFRNGLSDLVAEVPATGARDLVVESARFAQANGSFYLDFETGFAGKVIALSLPDDI